MHQVLLNHHPHNLNNRWTRADHSFILDMGTITTNHHHHLNRTPARPRIKYMLRTLSLYQGTRCILRRRLPIIQNLLHRRQITRTYVAVQFYTLNPTDDGNSRSGVTRL